MRNGRGGGERTLHDAEGDDEVLDSWVHRSTAESVLSLQPTQTWSVESEGAWRNSQGSVYREYYKKKIGDDVSKGNKFHIAADVF